MSAIVVLLDHVGYSFFWLWLPGKLDGMPILNGVICMCCLISAWCYAADGKRALSAISVLVALINAVLATSGLL